MITRYKNFLKRSIHTFPHDIAQPYHKIIDLILKITSITLGIFGGIKIYLASSNYFLQISNLTDSSRIMSITEKSLLYNHYFYSTVIEILFAFGSLGVAILIGIIIIVRHINETLPDHIYLRCFSTLEEKNKRLPIANE